MSGPDVIARAEALLQGKDDWYELEINVDLLRALVEECKRERAAVAEMVLEAEANAETFAANDAETERALAENARLQAELAALDDVNSQVLCCNHRADRDALRALLSEVLPHLSDEFYASAELAERIRAALGGE